MAEKKNNIDIPAHLNKNFFKIALETGLQQRNIRINYLNFAHGTSPGENYCSDIFRVQVNYTDCNDISHTTSVIIKNLDFEGKLAALKETGIFERERDVYAVIIPAMNMKLNGNALAPKCYYTQKDPICTMVFDDMKCKGYSNADRVKGLDEAHCALVFKKLGIFHGLSMVLAQKDPTLIKNFDNNLDTPEPMLNSLFLNNLKHLVEITAKWKGFEKISVKLNKLCENISDFDNKCNIALHTRLGEIQVLTHNDLWTNNILFKYADDSKKPEDLVFIDFQGSFYSSPGFDITHFLYTSPHFELLEKKRDFMIKEYYYKSLVSTLKEQNFSHIPSYDEILQEIEIREFASFLWALDKVPLICMDKELCGDNNIENLINDDAARKIREIGFATERCQSTVKHMLNRLDKMGVLEYSK